jgi:hypothetical protein
MYSVEWQPPMGVTALKELSDNNANAMLQYHKNAHTLFSICETILRMPKRSETKSSRSHSQSDFVNLTFNLLVSSNTTGYQSGGHNCGSARCACAQRPGLPRACHSGLLACLALQAVLSTRVAFAPRARLRQSFSRTLR